LGKIPKKIIENFGRQGCDLEWILEHKNLGKEFLDSKGNSENANMLCHDMHRNALQIWQHFIIAKSGCYKPTPLKESHTQDSGSARE
jgi:hypothetical protein